MPQGRRRQRRRPLNIAVVGAGAFGRNHLRVYRELASSRPITDPPVRVTAIVEPNLSQAASSLWPAEHLLPPPTTFDSVDALLAARERGDIAVDAASVCVPTTAHCDVTSSLLSAGIDVLVEKPIASTVAEADQMVALALHHSRILQVGHLERFNPAVLAASSMRHQPMFFEAHRLSIFSPRALDVDVVLDLMIHDLDIVLDLAQSPVREVHAVGLPIVSPQVDISNVRIEFDSGCVANFTASRVSTERVRKLRFFQPHQYISIDYARKDLLVIDVAPDTFLAEAAFSANHPVSPAASALPPGLRMHKPHVQEDEPLRLEIESFLECVRTRRTPLVTGDDGRRALALATRIHEAMSAHARRAGLERFML
ncbi:MAG: Gfo/Idh/MocA family oxidoreductase [Acidobacteria bacterium]|nr:Gfo/Idh/MocA family oxidoreductase [Acidobacteriota bacterium]